MVHGEGLIWPYTSLPRVSLKVPQSMFLIMGSAHNIKEIRLKEIQKVEKIFISSLFKKNKNYLGINRYKLLSKLSKKKIVVLGGISRSNVKKLKLINYPNFAGISYFE